MLLSVVLLIVGFVLLVKGADCFVDGASSIAKRLKIPSVVIGLTIVAFGTSMPELAVSLSAAIKGSNAIALSNVIGSNSMNLLLVIGISAMIQPLNVEKSLIQRDYPMSLLAAVVLFVLAFDTFWNHSTSMQLTRSEGMILLSFFVVFMYTAVTSSLQARKTIYESDSPESRLPKKRMSAALILTTIGLAGIVIGGNVVVDAATHIARMLHISETIIGLTIVAIGTSLPELVTSIVAARKGESDIALGNVVGSNIFNIFFILGISSFLHNIAVSMESIYDIIFLMGITLLFFLPMLQKKKVSRMTGLIMTLLYIVYMVYISVR